MQKEDATVFADDSEVKAAASQAKEKKEFNPYLAARAEWNERYGDYIKERDNWRLTAIAALACLLVAVFGVVYIGSQSKIKPYMVEVDQLGRTVTVGEIQPVAAADERIVKAMLGEWIKNIRSVTSDTIVQKKWLFKAYTMIGPSDPSNAKIAEYYGNGKGPNSPFVRSQTETVEIHIKTVLKQSEKSWEVEWVETNRNKDGLVTDQFPMRALLQVYYTDPGSVKQVFDNPAGIFISDYNWQKQI